MPWSAEEGPVYLRLGAVTSAVYVHVNGTRVGYSQDSKLPAEFDVTEQVTLALTLTPNLDPDPDPSLNPDPNPSLNPNPNQVRSGEGSLVIVLQVLCWLTLTRTLTRTLPPTLTLIQAW